MMEAEQVARPRNAAAGYLAGLSSDQHHCPRLHLTWSPPLPTLPPPPAKVASLGLLLLPLAAP